MFVDEADIEVAAGDGGNGSVSFRREKFTPRGGPDGGDGGKGGDVLLRVNPHLRTLYHLRHTPRFRAEDGRPGMGKQMFGASGADVVVEAPPGTIVADAATGEVVIDLGQEARIVVLARGGRGGRGNVHFKGPTRRTPRVAEEGKPGEARRLRLTLKLLADVGLVGLPNAGKSTFLARVSRAKPKIADYPFTTLAPALGIAAVNEDEALVVADLPGLIQGAHEGKGLGQRFLRHIERTRVLLVLIDILDPHPAKTLALLRDELARWSAELGSKEAIVCYSKGDLLAAEARGALPELEGARPPVISAHTGEGITPLLHELAERVRTVSRSELREGGASGADATDAEEELPDFGERPWPTRWVLPDRPGVCLTSEGRKRGG
ncbi:MAG: GTPase ObgE [Candidatus Eisenbacteria bacterium]|nr:GTPase ObgE [Candidatus Eisenbacteria bacterium]